MQPGSPEPRELGQGSQRKVKLTSYKQVVNGTMNTREVMGTFHHFLLMVLQDGQEGNIRDLAHLSSCAVGSARAQAPSLGPCFLMGTL